MTRSGSQESNYGIFDINGGSMKDISAIEYLVAVFCDQENAHQALIQLRDNVPDDIVIDEAAYLSKSMDGKISFNEPKDWGLGRGAALGAVVGGLSGVLLGPGVIFSGAIGAAVGGLAAKLYDTGFNNSELKQLSEALKPGTSALILAAQGNSLVKLDRLLVEAGAEVVTDALQPELAEKVSADFDEFLEKMKDAIDEGELLVRSGLVIGEMVAKNKDDIERLDIDPYKPQV
jgi:uncharacterized membrane protein